MLQEVGRVLDEYTPCSSDRSPTKKPNCAVLLIKSSAKGFGDGPDTCINAHSASVTERWQGKNTPFPTDEGIDTSEGYLLLDRTVDIPGGLSPST